MNMNESTLAYKLVAKYSEAGDRDTFITLVKNDISGITDEQIFMYWHLIDASYDIFVDY